MYRVGDTEAVQQNWLSEGNDGADATRIRMACMSDGALAQLSMGRRSRQKSTNGIDVDALEMVVNNDTDDAGICYAPDMDVAGLKTILNNKNYDYNNKMLDTDGNVVNGWALCNTHVHNVGGKENPKTGDENKKKMEEVIALKSTIFARMLRKQYDYIAAMTKQMKTQMQKAVMTAAAEASGAASSSSSGSSSGAEVAGTTSCAFMTPQEAASCLQRNMQTVNNVLSSKSSPDNAIRNQLDTDSKTLQSTIQSFGFEADKEPAVYKQLADCYKGKVSSMPLAKQCLQYMTAGISYVNNELTKLNRSSGQYK
jgi:hypothetical protein